MNNAHSTIISFDGNSLNGTDIFRIDFITCCAKARIFIISITTIWSSVAQILNGNTVLFSRAFKWFIRVTQVSCNILQVSISCTILCLTYAFSLKLIKKKINFKNDIIRDLYSIFPYTGKRDKYTLLKQQKITYFVTIFIVNNINPKLDCYDFFVWIFILRKSINCNLIRQPFREYMSRGAIKITIPQQVTIYLPVE